MKLAARITGSIIGVVVILMGAVWALQGIRVINYGFMAGHRRWLVLGLLLVVAGIVLVFFANRRPREIGHST